MSDIVERLRMSQFAYSLPCSVFTDMHDAANEIERLCAELETERMRLAACGVVAMSNTQESAARSKDMHQDYWCASVQDVANAVDREIALRAENEALRSIILWALGENGEFPDRPEKVEGKPHPLYWWRTEMRKRLDAAMREQK